MSTRISRRDALRRIGAAGAGALVGSGALVGGRALLAGGVIRGQSGDIVVAGRPVELLVSRVSPLTVRITVLPTDGPRAAAVPVDGALVEAARRARSGAEADGRDRRPRASRQPRRAVHRRASCHPRRHRGGRAGAAAHARQAGGGRDVPAGQGAASRSRPGRTPVRSQRHDRPHAQRTGGYQLSTHGGRVPIQWLVGTDGWAMFIHHPLGTFDFTGEVGRFTPASDALPLDFFVVSTSNPADTMREYARITGLAEMPPLWSFGYMQSHRTLAGPDEVLGVARTLREKKLPCDGLIYLGTEFTPSGWNTRNGEFTWHSGNFPDPKGTIDTLHDQHFKVVLHIVIEGRRLPGTVQEPCDPSSAVPSGRTPDSRWPDDRHVACYWPYHKPLFDLGVDGWWPDQGDDYDAPSRLNRTRMYYEGPQLWRPNERPFALHRNGYAGMQRYAAFLWSGDVQSRWETLRTHVPVAINTGLSGIPFWGTDIGGFIPTDEYTGELHVRWFQFGAFCPSFRAHGRHWHLRLPWGWDGGDGGPPETSTFKPDPAELNNPRVEPILRKYLELRYRLLPYTYTAVRECRDTGLPIVRALWLHYPGDPVAVARGDQYLWGRGPPGVAGGREGGNEPAPLPAARRLVRLLDRGEGARAVARSTRAVDLETMPLHVRAGAILPLGPVRQYVDERVDGPLTLIVYPGADGSASLYEDDGRSLNYRTRSQWSRITMKWRDRDRRLSLDFVVGGRGKVELWRPIELRVAGEQTTRTIEYRGGPLDIRL